MTKLNFIILSTIFFWSSAFVGIRAGLHHFSPEGLALLRYLIASFCMAIIYYRLPNRVYIPLLDRIKLLIIGVLAIGIYNLTLNYSELVVPSGTASFIVSQSPIITAILALIFLGETLTTLRILGFITSLVGIIIIASGNLHAMNWSISLLYIIIATVSGGVYTVMQKPFLKKYHPIQVTTYVFWGGTLFLALYFPHLKTDLMHATLSSTVSVVYLGVFPAAIAYLGWTYILSMMPAARAVSYLYAMPFVATLLGWLWLSEVPTIATLFGGILAILGVWLINISYHKCAAKLVTNSRSS